METLKTQVSSGLEGLYQEILQDSRLQERLKTARSPEELSEIALALGAERGFIFTKEEVMAAMAIEASIGEGYVEVGDSLEAEKIVAGCGCGIGRGPKPKSPPKTGNPNTSYP